MVAVDTTASCVGCVGGCITFTVASGLTVVAIGVGNGCGMGGGFTKTVVVVVGDEITTGGGGFTATGCDGGTAATGGG